MKNQFEDRETGREVRKKGCIEIVLGNKTRYVDYESCLDEKKRFVNLKEADDDIYVINFAQIKNSLLKRILIGRVKGSMLRLFLPKTYQSFYLENEVRDE